MTRKKPSLSSLTPLMLVLTGTGTACSSQSFQVGSLSDTDGGDAGLVGDDGGALASIDPIALNDAWTYDVTVAGTYPACTNGSGVASVTQHSTIDGKDAFYVSSFCAALGSFWYSADGDRVYEYDGTNWLLALDAPVEDAHTWSNGSETFVWKKIGAIAVPAGNFADCWEVDDQAAPTYYAVTFCRGVGPVKWHYRDASQNGYDAVLTNKNF